MKKKTKNLSSFLNLVFIIKIICNKYKNDYNIIILFKVFLKKNLIKNKIKSKYF
jgi:hypothetical protein